ncbi:MAG: hypothetical protein ABEH59_13690 [Halobacteriales archaeon]
MVSTRAKLLVLLAIVAAIGLITATGAFGSVSAQRTATVNVAGDDAALIGLEPGSAGGASDIVEGTDEIKLNLTNVNTNATLEYPDVLNITNRGTQAVAVQITRTGANSGAIAFAVQSDQLDGSQGSADLTWPETNAWRIDDSGSPIDLQPGESIQVGIYIDTSDSDASDGLTPGSSAIGAGTEIITSVTVDADASDVDSGNLKAG